MVFGQSFSSNFGEPDHALAGMDVSQVGTTLRIVLYGRSGLGESWFGVYQNCKLMRSVYLADGATSEIFYVPAEFGSVSVMALSSGWNSSFDQSDVARGLDSETASRATIRWDYSPEILQVVNTDGTTDVDLYGFTLTGLTPSNGTVSSFTRRTMTATLQVSAGVATLTIDAGSTTITGTGAPGYTMTLSDGAGITGSAYINPLATTITKNVTFRYPTNTKVYRDGALVATVSFTGNTGASFTDEVLSMGTYNYTLKDTSDTGTLGVATTPIPVVIEVIPNPVTDLAYFSGDQTSTVITWTPTTTPDCIYNVYLRRVGDPVIDVIEPYTTVSSPSALLTNIAPTAGIAEVIVRVQSLVSLLEEKNPFILELEYDGSGNYVPPRPNVARISSAKTSAAPWPLVTDSTVTVKVIYPSAGEAGVAKTVNLYARPLNGSYTPTPAATATLAGTGNKTATLTTTASGWWAFNVKAATAAGVLSGEASQEVVLFCSGSSSLPSNVTAVASRG